MKKKIIFIPHLSYTIEVRDKAKATGAARKYGEYMELFHEKVSSRLSIIHLHEKHLRPVNFPLLAHEVVHVLQHIAQIYDIDFKTEEEHFAYLMQFILNQILGYEAY